MRWWHATPDVTILMFSVLFGLILFVMMLWSLMRCNQVWVYTYLREKKKLSNTMKMLLLFWGRRRGPDSSATSSLATGHYQARFCPAGGEWQVRGSGLGLGKAGHPCSSSNGRWELLYHQLCFSLPSPSCVVRTSTVKKTKGKKSNPLLWVCYPSKDTRPLSLWFAVRIELFFKLILPQRLLRNYFEYI